MTPSLNCFLVLIFLQFSFGIDLPDYDEATIRKEMTKLKKGGNQKFHFPVKRLCK